MLSFRGGINLKEYSQVALTAALWTPGQELDNMILWLRPDADVTFQDAGRTVPIVDGANALGITDKSPNENHMSQAAGPVWVENGLNGYPILRFNGLSNFLNYAKTIIGSAMTVAIVCEAAVGQTTHLISEYILPNRYHIAYRAVNFETRFYTGAAYLGGSQTSAADTDPHVLVSLKDVLTVDLYKDGVIGAGLGSDAVVPIAHRNIGADEASQYYNGDIIEVIAWSVVLGVDVLASLNAYFSRRYGIAVS